jgi:RNA polymerase sigma factor (sigma-70 family)
MPGQQQPPAAASVAGLAHALARLAEGSDADSWQTVYVTAVPHLRRILASRSDDHELVEDALQDAVLQIRAGAASFRNPDVDADRVAMRWMAAVAMHALRRLQRSTRRIRRAAEQQEPQADEHAAASFLEQEELQRTLASAIRALPAGMRRAVSLHYLDGLPLAEIAQALGQPLGTVKTNLHRARALLRASLQRAGIANAAIVLANQAGQAARLAPATDAHRRRGHGSPAGAERAFSLATPVILALLTLGVVGWWLGGSPASRSAVALPDAGAARQEEPGATGAPEGGAPASDDWLSRPVSLHLARATLLEAAFAILAQKHPPRRLVITVPGLTAGPNAWPITLSGQMSARAALDAACAQSGARWRQDGECLVFDDAGGGGLAAADGRGPQRASVREQLEDGGRTERVAALRTLIALGAHARLPFGPDDFWRRLPSARRGPANACWDTPQAESLYRGALRGSTPALRAVLLGEAYGGDQRLEADVLAALSAGDQPRPFALALAGLFKLRGAADDAWMAMADARYDPLLPAQVLGMIAPPERLAAIVAMADGEDARARAQAILALGWYRQRAAVTALLALWRHPRAEADRGAILRALGCAGDERALSALVPALSSAPLRATALAALCRIPTPAGATALLAALDGPAGAEAERDQELTRQVAIRMGQGDDLPQDLLIADTEAGHASILRQMAAGALGLERASVPATDRLISLLEDQDSALASAAAHALASSLRPEAMVALAARVAAALPPAAPVRYDDGRGFASALALAELPSQEGQSELRRIWSAALERSQAPPAWLILAVGLLHEQAISDGLERALARWPDQALPLSLALAETRDPAALERLTAAADGDDQAGWSAQAALAIAAGDGSASVLAALRHRPPGPGALAWMLTRALDEPDGPLATLLGKALLVATGAAWEHADSRASCASALAEVCAPLMRSQRPFPRQEAWDGLWFATLSAGPGGPDILLGALAARAQARCDPAKAERYRRSIEDPMQLLNPTFDPDHALAAEGAQRR